MVVWSMIRLLLVFLLFYFIMYFCIQKEYFQQMQSTFPDNEAKFYKSLKNTYGIAQCKYQGMTPILTCSYDSKI